MKRDISKYIENVKKIIDNHNLGQIGAYCRWLWQPTDSAKPHRDLGLNEYGCADAANILYMIGKFEDAIKTFVIVQTVYPKNSKKWIDSALDKI